MLSMQSAVEKSTKFTSYRLWNNCSYIDVKKVAIRPGLSQKT